MEIKEIIIRQFTGNDYRNLYRNNKELLYSPLALEDQCPYTEEPNLIGTTFDDDIMYTNNIKKLDEKEIFYSYKVY